MDAKREAQVISSSRLDSVTLLIVEAEEGGYFKQGQTSRKLSETKKRNFPGPGWECAHRRHPLCIEDSFTQNWSLKHKSKQVYDFVVFYQNFTFILLNYKEFLNGTFCMKWPETLGSCIRYGTVFGHS